MRPATLVVLAALLAGCASGSDPSPREIRISGSTAGGPVDHPVDVPVGGGGLRTTLSWRPAEADLDLGLFGPDGLLIARGAPDGAARLLAVTIEPPAPGPWTVRVQPAGTERIEYELVVEIEPMPSADSTHDTRLRVTPGGFAEWNLILRPGGEFSYTFEADAPLAWDVHTHEDGGLRKLARGEGADASGTLVASQAGIHSILWEGAPAAGATVHVRVVGPVRVHSQHG